MTKENKVTNKATKVKDWDSIIKGFKPGDLTEEEKAQFSRAQFASEQAKKTNFVLGGPIVHIFYIVLLLPILQFSGIVH